MVKNRIPFFDAVSTLTEETRDARRTIPKAILIVACPGCLCSAIWVVPYDRLGSHRPKHKAAVRMRKPRVPGKGAPAAGECRWQSDVDRSRPWLGTRRHCVAQLMKCRLHCVIAPGDGETLQRNVAVSLLHGSSRRGKTGKGRHRTCLVSTAVSWSVLLRRCRSSPL